MKAAAWPPFDADGAQGDRRVARSAVDASRVQRRERLVPGVQVVPVGRAVELDRLADEPGTGRPGAGVDLEVRVRQVGPRVGQAEQAGEVGIGPHGDEVAAAVDPGREHRRLRGADGDVAEDDDVVVGEQRGVDGGDVDRVERVQALVPQDLDVVAAERVGRRRRRRGSGHPGPRPAAAAAAPRS